MMPRTIPSGGGLVSSMKKTNLKPGDMFNATKNRVKKVISGIGSIRSGMQSGKKMVANATKKSQAKVYKNVSPATKMTGQLIESGMKPRTAKKTSYNDALKAVGPGRIARKK